MTGRVFPEDGSWPRARVTPLDQEKMKQLINALVKAQPQIQQAFQEVKQIKQNK